MNVQGAISNKTALDNEAFLFDACCPVIESEVTHNFASGILIAPRLILTAWHAALRPCFVRIPAWNVASGPRLDAIAIEHAPQNTDRRVDLALLVLQSDAGVEPARLATDADFIIACDRGVTLCGFGFTRDRFGNLASAGIKRVTWLPIDTHDAGEFVAGGIIDGKIHDAEEGDSGGPAYLETKQGMIVVGIDSRNAAGHKSVFTRVDAHLDWIYKTAAEHGISLGGGTAS
ncbi:MAG: trypsin-like serine protease [Bryobacteraceae bacterium]